MSWIEIDTQERNLERVIELMNENGQRLSARPVNSTTIVQRTIVAGGGSTPSTPALWTIETRTGQSGSITISTVADRLWLRLDVVGAVTIGLPSGIPVGGEIAVVIVQDAAGDRQVLWASGWKFNAEAPLVVGSSLTAMVVRGVMVTSSTVWVTSVQNEVIA